MTHNKLARAKMDQVVNDWPEACWLCVKYNLVIDGSVASGCTIPVMTMSGSKTLSQRRYSGEPVFRKYMPLVSLDRPWPYAKLAWGYGHTALGSSLLPGPRAASPARYVN